MAWVGKGSVSYKFGGAPSFIRLGDYAVPREMTFTFTGAGLDPDFEALLVVREGRPQCVRITIDAKDDGRPLRTSDLDLWRIDLMVSSLFARESSRVVDDPKTGVTTMTPSRSVPNGRGVRFVGTGGISPSVKPSPTP